MGEKISTILHILEHMQVGGIRTKLFHMLKNYPEPNVRHVLLAFDESKGLKHQFNALANVVVECEPDAADWSLLGGALRTFRISEAINRHAPSVLHSWHMSTNMNLLPITPFIGKTPAVLSVDCPSVVAEKKEPLTTMRLKALAAMHLAGNVYVHSISARTTDALVEAGMNRDDVLELGNGVDVDCFQPILNAKRDICHEFGLREDTFIIGGAGRHSKEDPSKDIPNVLYAAAALKRINPELYDKCAFMVCGKGTEDGALHEIARVLGVADKSYILGPRHDMPVLYSAWSISNICSLYEPFGLVLPEAMACETVCVATNVDMLPQILNGNGFLVEPGDGEGRAHAWERILTMEPEQRRRIGVLSREHVVRHYNDHVVNAEYAVLYKTLATHGGRHRPHHSHDPQPIYL